MCNLHMLPSLPPVKLSLENIATLEIYVHVHQCGNVPYDLCFNDTLQYENIDKALNLEQIEKYAMRIDNYDMVIVHEFFKLVVCEHPIAECSSLLSYFVA